MGREAIYAAGLVGFWRMAPWMHPWAALYVAQIAIGMLVWSVLDDRGTWIFGGVAAVVFTAIAFVLFAARDRFQRAASSG